jgi:periplasmic mercuric ion binding protein
MRRVLSLAVAVILGMGVAAMQTEAAEQKVTLVLGGKFCEFYPKEITGALMKVKGVTDVDLKSMSGHAIVTTDGTVKPEELVAAMKGVKGTKMGIEWYCTAEVMK